MRDGVVCFGEILLRLAAPGRELLLQSPALALHVGGAEANVAAALSRWGHATRMISTLADNALGAGCRDALRAHGVDTATIRLAAGRMGLYFLTHGAGHRPAEVLYDRADSAFARAADYDWDAGLAGAAWLHISGITCAVSAAAAEAALQAVSAATRLGVRVSFDCNYRAKLWAGRAGEAPAILRRMCADATLLFAEDRDIALALGLDIRHSEDTAQRAAADAAFAAFPRLQWIAATRRTRYSVDRQDLAGVLFGRSDAWESRSYALVGIVDRIGSGDAFAAGLLRGQLLAHAPGAALEFAAAVACLKHTIPGDACLASVADIEALLADSPVDVRR